jgi:hypothetical protein
LSNGGYEKIGLMTNLGLFLEELRNKKYFYCAIDEENLVIQLYCIGLLFLIGKIYVSIVGFY